jgi:tetratricopeptide (TPR) repeat protein
VTRLFLTALLLAVGLAGCQSNGMSAQSETAHHPATGLVFDPARGTFTEAPPPEGGWQAFADQLNKAAPAVNTGIALTPAQVTQHIATLIDTGKPEAALEVIGQRTAARAASGAIGTDVQLDYQHGRALAALGRHDEAMALWRRMTIDYPELPEPWNALAIEYARLGALEQARESLEMALASDPSFAPALQNLGHIQMRLAQESFSRAARVRSGHGKHAPGGSTPGTAPPPAAQ